MINVYISKNLVRFLFIIPFFFTTIISVGAALSPGDLAVIGMNADVDAQSTTRSFAVVALARIDAGEEIFFTDRGWVNAPVSATGHFVGAMTSPPPSAATTNEGRFRWTPSADIPAGTVITFTINLAVRVVSGVRGNGTALPPADLIIIPGTWTNENLLANPWPTGIGDQILIYQGTESAPSFIFAFNNLRSSLSNVSNGWFTNPSNSDPITQIQGYSELPAGLPANCALGFLTPNNNNNGSRYPNGIYNPAAGAKTKKAWLDDITSRDKWSSSSANNPYNFSGVFSIDNIEFIVAAIPTVTAAKISISGANGPGGIFRIGDIVTAVWDNTASGDANAGITAVTMDFTQFGGGAEVAATNSSGTWTATYTVTAGTINGTTNLNVAVKATSGAGSTTTSGTNNVTVDNQPPSVAITSSAGLSGGITYDTPIPVTVTFSEAVSVFVSGDIAVSNATISGFSGSGTTYTFDLIPAVFGVVTVNIAENTAEDAAANGNSAAQQFTIDYQLNLPVTLVRYTAKAEGNAALLEWSTANETDNSHFEIEHSTDARTFKTIGRVEVSGSSSVRRNYSWYHSSPANGRNYYRLVQVDLDGTTTRFGVKSLIFGNTEAVMLYPNPAGEAVTVALPEKTETVELSDLNGRLLRKVSVGEDKKTVNIPVSDLAPGSYIIRLLTADGEQSGKVVKP